LNKEIGEAYLTNDESIKIISHKLNETLLDNIILNRSLEDCKAKLKELRKIRKGNILTYLKWRYAR